MIKIRPKILINERLEAETVRLEVTFSHIITQ